MSQIPQMINPTGIDPNASLNAILGATQGNANRMNQAQMNRAELSNRAAMQKEELQSREKEGQNNREFQREQAGQDRALQTELSGDQLRMAEQQMKLQEARHNDEMAIRKREENRIDRQLMLESELAAIAEEEQIAILDGNLEGAQSHLDRQEAIESELAQLDTQLLGIQTLDLARNLEFDPDGTNTRQVLEGILELSEGQAELVTQLSEEIPLYIDNPSQLGVYFSDLYSQGTKDYAGAKGAIDSFFSSLMSIGDRVMKADTTTTEGRIEQKAALASLKQAYMAVQREGVDMTNFDTGLTVIDRYLKAGEAGLQSAIQDASFGEVDSQGNVIAKKSSGEVKAFLRGVAEQQGKTAPLMTGIALLKSLTLNTSGEDGTSVNRRLTGVGRIQVGPGSEMNNKIKKTIYNVFAAVRGAKDWEDLLVKLTDEDEMNDPAEVQKLPIKVRLYLKESLTRSLGRLQTERSKFSSSPLQGDEKMFKKDIEGLKSEKGMNTAKQIVKKEERRSTIQKSYMERRKAARKKGD
jgi:hypothetical protein